MDHARGANLQGKLCTDPACYWIFARFARQGAHPFFVRDLEKLRDSMEANARGPLQGRASEKLEAPPGQDGEKPAPSPLVRPLPWLEKSIGERGLIRAMEDPAHPYACRTYPTALAITHFALAGARGAGARYLEEGKALWNAMQRLRGPDGAWLDAYDMRSGAGYPGPRNRATGPNSWMALAGIHLSEASQSPEILEQARETLDWVLSFQDLDPAHESFGAITLGEVSYPNAISTEASADALAAAWGFWVASGKKENHQRYAEAARQIGRWLRKSQWLGDHFGSGSSRPNGPVEMRNEWLDSQTWTLLALEGAREADGSDPRRYNGLPWLDEKLTHVPYKGSVLHGFAKVSAGPDAFWPEGVA